MVASRFWARIRFVDDALGGVNVLAVVVPVKVNHHSTNKSQIPQTQCFWRSQITQEYELVKEHRNKRKRVINRGQGQGYLLLILFLNQLHRQLLSLPLQPLLPSTQLLLLPLYLLLNPSLNLRPLTRLPITLRRRLLKRRQSPHQSAKHPLPTALIRRQPPSLGSIRIRIAVGVVMTCIGRAWR